MGRLRPISHRSFPIRFRQRTAETELESWRRLGCFSRGARLSWIATDRRDRLAICEHAGCATWTMAQLRRQQSFCDRAASSRTAIGATGRQQQQRQEITALFARNFLPKSRFQFCELGLQFDSAFRPRLIPLQSGPASFLQVLKLLRHFRAERINRAGELFFEDLSELGALWVEPSFV